MTEQASGLLLEIGGVRTPDLTGHRIATRECLDMGLLSGSKPNLPISRERLLRDAAAGGWRHHSPNQCGTTKVTSPAPGAL